MCVTGATLSFESNILEFAEREMRVANVSSANAERLPVREIINKIQGEKPNAKLSSIALRNETEAAAVIGLGRDGQIFVNPYTGEITGEGAKGWRGFFRTVEDLHRWLAFSGDARQIGRTINDACNLLFLFLAVSGIYIWFPRRLSRQHFKPVLWFRRGLKGKARDFNWHNTIGFWSSLVLIILTATAVVMSYQWANNLVYTLTGNQPPQQQQQQTPNQQGDTANVLPENLDAIWSQAITHTSWNTITLRLPVTNDSAVFTVDEGIYPNMFGRSTLTIDAKTAQVSKWEPYGEQNSGRRLRSWVRFTHTGETGGIIGQIIGFFACIGGAFLVWTGFSLAWRRFRSWQSKSSNETAPDDI